MRGRAPGPPGASLLVLLAACSLALTGCGGEGPAPDLSDSEAVEFDSRDGVELEGRLFGEGATAVVLSHMLPADQRSWFDYAGRLAEQGAARRTHG